MMEWRISRCALHVSQNKLLLRERYLCSRLRLCHSKNSLHCHFHAWCKNLRRTILVRYRKISPLANTTSEIRSVARRSQCYIFAGRNPECILTFNVRPLLLVDGGEYYLLPLTRCKSTTCNIFVSVVHFIIQLFRGYLNNSSTLQEEKKRDESKKYVFQNPIIIEIYR